jgi:replicative DNA helicase
MLNTSMVAHETEQQFLGSIIYEGELIHDTTIKPAVFNDAGHKIIYDGMLKVKAKDLPLDLTTLVQELGNEGMEQLAGKVPESPITYLSQLAGSIPTTANFKYLESKLVEHWKVRASQKRALQFAERPDLETLTQLTRALNDIEQAGDRRIISNSERLRRIYDKIEAGKQGDVTGLDMGFTELNRMTEGLQDEQFTIVAARPSVGKTALMLNITRNILTKDPNAHVTIFSLEMSAEQLLERMAGAFARIPLSAIKARSLTGDQWTKLTAAMGWLDNANLTIYDDTGMTTSQMRADMRGIMREFPDRKHSMFIDYLTIIKPDDLINMNRTQQLGQIGNDLKNIAKKLKIPVVCLAQLSRGVEGRQNKRPSMSDIRDSGEIEQIADMIWLLYRDDYYDRETENKNIIEIIIDKQRDGATGTVSLAFVKEYGLFVNLQRNFD